LSFSGHQFLMVGWV